MSGRPDRDAKPPHRARDRRADRWAAVDAAAFATAARLANRAEAQRRWASRRPNAAPLRAAPGRGRGPAPIGFGRVDPLFVVGSDGFIHSLYVSNGAEMEPPVPFLPPDAKPSALIWIDGIVYTTTSGECGAAPNALWAMDLNVPVKERKAVSWKTGAANIAGTSGLAFGSEGAIYVALATGATAAPAPDSIVALRSAKR